MKLVARLSIWCAVVALLSVGASNSFAAPCLASKMKTGTYVVDGVPKNGVITTSYTGPGGNSRADYGTPVAGKVNVRWAVFNMTAQVPDLGRVDFILDSARVSPATVVTNGGPAFFPATNINRFNLKMIVNSGEMTLVADSSILVSNANVKGFPPVNETYNVTRGGDFYVQGDVSKTIRVRIPAGGTVAVNHGASLPALSTWAAIALALLIMSTAMFAVLRRKDRRLDPA